MREMSCALDVEPLHDAYRLSCVRAAGHEDDIVRAISCLREAGVEPILAKGWAIARLYALPGLRPSGDIDLHVPPNQYEQALRALPSNLATAGVNVDLQARVPDLRDRRWSELYARSRVEPLGPAAVRVLCPEDHLRLICRHFLRHGAWRSVWLCDVGAFVEGLPPDFDWNLCLGGEGAAGIVWVLALARSLLGAKLDGAPPAVQQTEPAPWFAAAVARRWETDTAPSFKLTTIDAFRRPDWFLRALRERWPDPVTATAELGGPWNGLPRLPVQAAAFGRRIVAWASPARG
jgi:hypothetical protein